MKNRTAKILALVMALCMLLGALSACTQTPPPAATTTAPEVSAEQSEAPSEESAAPSEEYQWEYQQDTSPFEFNVWWPSVWGWAKKSVAEGWTDNPVYNYITEKTGGKMIIDMPSATEDELIGPIMASGETPEVMVFGAFTSPYINQMKDAGQIYSWSELIDQYAPKMWDLISPSQMAYHADDKGILWKFVGFEYSPKWFEAADECGVPYTHGTNIMFTRKDLLAAYGKTDITDLDDFTNYLYSVKQNDPEADPLRIEADPRGGLFTHFRSTFGCHLSNTYVNGEELKYFMYDPAYVDYLKWLNGLYKGGILTTNMLTEDAQIKEEKMYAAKYGAIMSATYTAYNTLEQAIVENVGEDKTYVAVGPISKPGIKWEAIALRSKGGQATVITKSAKLPDRIIKFFEFLLSDEGQMVTNSGVEGDMYDIIDGKWVMREEPAKMAAADLEGYVTKYKVNGPWSPWTDTYYWERYLGAVLTPAGRAKDENVKRLSSVRDIWEEGFADIETCIPGGSDLEVLRTKAYEVCRAAAVKMIAAKDDAEFQSLYDACIAEIEALGIQQVNDAYTAEHLKQLKALGLK